MSLSISNARFRRESAAKQVALQQKDVALQEKVVALGDKNQALAVTREKESLAQSRLYAAQMSLAQRAWEGGERARTVELLETLRPHENEPDRRGFEWSYLYSLSHPNLLRTWRAHDSIVNGVAWSPDGAMFATCNEHNGVRFWDGRTGEHLGDLPVEDPDNWDLAFSPDGELLATAGGTLEGRLVVWDVPTKRKLWQHKAHPVPFGIRALAISPDSRVIATCAWDGPSNPNFGTTKLWNAKDGELLATLRDQKGGVYRVAFSRDGKLLATAGASWEKDTRICLWDLKLPTVAKRWEVKNVGAAGFSFSEDGQTLFAGNIGGVQLIDVPTGKLGYTLGEPPSEYSVVRQVPGKKQIVSASLDRTLRLWDLETRDSVPLGAELASVTAMAIDPKGERIACGDEHGWVSLRTLAEPKVPPSFHGIGVIKSISFAPDGRSLVAAGSPLSVLDRSTLEVLATGPDKVLAISPDNMLAAIYDPADQRCTIWNIKSREHGRSMEVGAIHQARFSPDGKQLATWARWESPILQLWNTDSGERIERLKPYAFSVMSVAFSPDGRYLAAALQFNEIGVYDLAKKTWSIHNFSNGFQCANVVEYSPQGNTLAAGVVQGGAILFDVHPQSGALKLRSRLSGITQGVNAIAFNPDGLSLVTAGADGSVRFSDTATGQERGTITMAAKSLAFSPNGKQLAIADDKGTVRVLVAGPNAAMEQKSDR